MGSSETFGVSQGPLGPAGVNRRIQEIQDRMRSVLGTPSTPEFASHLTGEIGALTPMSPNDAGIVPTGGGEYRDMAKSAALRYGIDPELFSSLIEQESGFDPSARSSKGALGLSQLMPETAASLGVTDRTDPVQSLDGGARYLAEMMQKFKDPRLALAAYNAGPAAVQHAGGIPNFRETERYVDNIMRRYSARSTQ